MLSLACGVYFWGLALCFGKQRPAILRALLPARPWGTAPRAARGHPVHAMDRPCCPPLHPFFPFYFCNRFRGGHTRTMHSAVDAVLCIGTFAVSLLIISCCLAGYHRTPCSRCWGSALSVSSIDFVNADI